MNARFALSVAAFTALASSAYAADLPVAPPALPVFTWTGFYVGGNLGGKWATTSGSAIEAPIPAVAFAGSSEPFGSVTTGTFMGGGQLGYNWQSANWVFGIEGDGDWQHWATTRTNTTNFPPGTLFFVTGNSFNVSANWQASLRGRIGYAWDRWLVYATGGVAFTGVKAGDSFVAVGVAAASGPFTAQQTLVGATVGGGVEYAISDHVTIGAEGRYTWYGTHTFNTGFVNFTAVAASVATQSISLNTAEGLLKLNYKF